MRRSFCTMILLLILTSTRSAFAADYYVCDCDTNSDSDCQPGNDSANGTAPATPWQSYNKARLAFATLAAGDAIHFCRGGALEATQGARWVNAACRAANPCVVDDYTPPWASGDEAMPIVWVRSDQNAFSLEDGGNADHEEGYVFRNLELRCTVCDQTHRWGFFLYNDIDDVLLDHLVIDGFGIGVHLAGSNPCSSDPKCDGQNDRLTLRNSTIVNSHSQGFLGSGNETIIEGNVFENNGTRATFDHNIYYSGAAAHTSGSRILNNELYHSAWEPTGSCTATSLVVHGEHDDLVIEGNRVWEDVGGANQGCWGIAVDPGYQDEAEGFTNVAIRSNTVINVGNLGIGVSSCQNCVIENNVIVQEQDFNFRAIAAPSKARTDSNDLPETNVDVRNNSIYVSGRGGTGIRVGGEGNDHLVVSNAIAYAGTGTWNCFALDLATTDYQAVDNNVCWFPNASNGEWVNGIGTNPNPLSAWQAASGFGSASQEADPGYANPAGPTFDLSSINGHVAMVDHGHPTLSAPLAFDGPARDSYPDVGAYEWGAENPKPDGGVDGDGSISFDGGTSDGQASDSGLISDGSVEGDAQSTNGDGGPTSGAERDTGCGCRSQKDMGGAWLLGLLGLLLLIRRRTVGRRGSILEP
ncbi:MAG: right-handed parallel beta-helix repeat-containing protein [Deltaproteobacteria bacterium]|nr:right-handed parallel beta-helix repeat-containing protein [Deltaproteobacteria bacterium]